MTEEAKFEAKLASGTVLRSGEAISSWGIRSNYTSGPDSFSFSFKPRTRLESTNLELMPLELYLDGRLQLIGRIATSTRGHRGSVIDVTGWDYRDDLKQGNVDPGVKIVAGDKLDSALLLAMGPYGITGLEDPEKKMELRTGKAPTKMPKLVWADVQHSKPKPGDGCFQWCNQIAARHALTLQCATTRSLICLEAPNFIQSATAKFVRRDSSGAGSNIVTAQATRDYSTVPTLAKIVGAAGSSTETVAITNYEWDLWTLANGFAQEVQQTLLRWTVSGRRKVTDKSPLSGGKLYRLLHWKDKNAKTLSQVGATAWRIACDQLKRTLIYDVTVRGTKDPVTGYTYAVNTMADVDDEDSMVKETMWCASCYRRSSDEEGTLTTLQYWHPGSYQIATEGHG